MGEHDALAQQVAQLARCDVASGSRSARNRCASVSLSTASVFTRAEAIAFVRNGCARCSS